MTNDVTPDVKLYLHFAFGFAFHFDIISVVLKLSLCLYWPISIIENILHTIDYDSLYAFNYTFK